MTVESASFISGLVPAYPPGSDSISEGDDHLRLLKSVLQGTFPNANAAINGIHTGTSEPSSKTAGTIWYDTTASNKVLKVYNGSSFVTLPISPEVAFKLMGATNVGWVLPTADGIADQFLKTDGSGNLDWTSASGDELPSQTGHSGKYLTTNGSAASWAATTGALLGATHAICGASSYIREDSYYDTGFTITHTKVSATTDLYVNVNFYCNYASNFDTGSFQAYLQLTNSSGTIITGTPVNLQYIHLDDLEIGSNPTADFSTGYSRWFKVTAANCPDGTTGANTFDIYTKLTAAAKADGGVIVGPGSMMVLEI